MADGELITSSVPADVQRAVSRLAAHRQGTGCASDRRVFVVSVNRVVLQRLMPGQQILEDSELREIDTMLAEACEEWTSQWQEKCFRHLPEERRQKGLQPGLQEGCGGRSFEMEGVDRLSGTKTPKATGTTLRMVEGIAASVVLPSVSRRC